MRFDDDEQIADIQQDSGLEPGSINVGKAKAVVKAKKHAPLEQTEFKVLVTVTGGGTGNDRAGVDIVAVLDVSGSMEREDRIGKLKIAMQFLIRKLSPSDRLSIVKFSAHPERMSALRQVTTDLQSEFIDMVQGLHPGGETNIKGGLETALQVLNDRKFSEGRVGAIMLMSDGDEYPTAGAIHVPLGDVPVHTFGFGKDYNPTVLNEIAKNSKEGTFALADVDNTVSSSLSMAFSQCLAGLLTVSVQDLKVTVQPLNYLRGTNEGITPKIQAVYAGNYPQSGPDQNDGSFTVSFGNLYIKEKRTVLVNLLLPRVTQPLSARVLKITHTYRAGVERLKAKPIDVTVTRTPNAVDQELDEIVVEEKRLQAANMMKDATDLADNNNLQGAREKLVDAHDMLDDVILQDPNCFQRDIDMMKSEVQQYKKFMKSPEIYRSQGRPFALSSQTSHARQRFSARGDPDKQRQFSTPRMEAYRDQAKNFDKDPTKPPASVDEDVKEEIAADPLAPFAGALEYYLEQAIQSLQAIQAIISRRA